MVETYKLKKLCTSHDWFNMVLNVFLHVKANVQLCLSPSPKPSPNQPQEFGPSDKTLLYTRYLMYKVEGSGLDIVSFKSVSYFLTTVEVISKIFHPSMCSVNQSSNKIVYYLCQLCWRRLCFPLRLFVPNITYKVVNGF